jgi:chemotaxis signal transduction protein
VRSGFPFVEGMALIRGEPTPVVNLALLLGDAERAPIDRLVALRVGARALAIGVSSIRAVRSLDVR